MSRILITSLCFCLFTLSLTAQNEEPVFGYSGLRLTGIWGGPSSGISKYGENNVFHNGAFLGLEFNNLVFLGWGWYNIKDEIRFKELPVQSFNMRYNGFMIGVSAMPNKIVHPKFALLIGSGKIDIQLEEINNVFILQPSAGLEINLFRWCHLSLEGGYRMAANTNYAYFSDADLSSWFAELKVRLGFSWGW